MGNGLLPSDLIFLSPLANLELLHAFIASRPVLHDQLVAVAGI